MIGAEPPDATGTIARTILAAVAAFLAEHAGERTPAGVRHTKPLAEPWHPGGTPRMVRQTMAETSAALARFNVWLRALALQRPRT